MFFFFKQKTAYEMRISDWSSDVCSSDLDDHVAAVEQCQGLALARQAHADRAMQQVPVEGVHRLAEFEHHELGDVDQQRHRADAAAAQALRSEEHKSEIQSLMRISYSVFCLQNKNSTL